MAGDGIFSQYIFGVSSTVKFFSISIEVRDWPGRSQVLTQIDNKTESKWILTISMLYNNNFYRNINFYT